MRIIWLMNPAENETMVRKGIENTDADAYIPCLEDGAAYSDEVKQQARDIVTDAKADYDWSDKDLYPRINKLNSRYWEDDADALVPIEPDGFVIPKATSPESVRHLSEHISDLEAEHGIEEGSTGLITMIETTTGLRNAYDLATADPRVEGVLFGKEDYSASLRCLKDDDRRYETLRSGLDYSRGKVAVDASAADVEAIDGPPFSYEDTDYMFHDCDKSARMGFTGKLVAHPNQVEPAKKGFAPSEEEVDRAKQMLDLEADATDAGRAAVGAVESQEVTPPVVDQARLVLERADRLGTRESYE
jgi:citrate lyase subunit beta/citryl-CoA lyase